MNDIDEQLKNISEMRTMMERSSKFLSLSGLSGISAGIVAIIGAGFANVRLHEAYGENIERSLLINACLMLITAFGLAIFFSSRMAQKKNLPVWNHTTKYLLGSLFVPLSAGGTLCLILWYHGMVILVGPLTLIFYGLALLNISKYTLKEVQYLSIAEIVLGLLASVYLGSWLLFWALGFGVLHVAYGIFMYVKYEK